MGDENTASGYLTQQFHPVGAVERGVIDAILALHQQGIFTEVLDALGADVKPKYADLNRRELERNDLGFSSYQALSSAHDQARIIFDTSLTAWSRQFRLTQDSSQQGQSLQWALQFGQAWCLGVAAYPSIPGRESTRKVWLPLKGGWPDPAREKFSIWEKRIKPSLRAWYDEVRNDQRSKISRQRNPDRYKWFVLAVCARYSYARITERMTKSDVVDSVHRKTKLVSESAVAKGISKVCEELGIVRKVPS